MKKWRDTFGLFLRDKVYVLALAIAALAGYGFLITHSAVGIDDTPYAYYFQEGLAAIVGRWVLFLLNKVLFIGEYAPFFTDFAAVLILMLAVTVWAVFFYSIFGDRIPKWGYGFFAVLFLTNPLISEVFTYFLHNGIAIGYLCSGISLCALQESRWRLGLTDAAVGERAGEPAGKRTRLQSLPFMAVTVAGLWIALGCYESFMIVWLLGVLLMLLSERLTGRRGRVIRSLILAAVAAVAGLVLRSAAIALVTKVFGLEYMRDEAVQRSVTELASWMLEPGALSEFFMVLKRVFVMYGVFAYAYYPIAIFLLASVVIAIVALVWSIRKRDPWILLLMLGSFVTSFLLTVVEGKATLYRSAQFLPLLSAYGLLLLVYALASVGKKAGATFRRMAGGAVGIVFSVICFNQCSELNSWFYIDYMKYEAAMETMRQVAYELERYQDTTKPVIFTGTYEIPSSLVQKAYVVYNSETFYKMKRITDRVDEHLLEKFYRDYGVWVAQTPSLSVIEWGRYAFGDDSELVRFFAMHGHTLVPMTDSTRYEELEQYSLELPSFPREGSIVDMGDFLIVHF